MDERLAIPKMKRSIIMRALHFGHPGRDSMFAAVSNVLLSRLHRKVVATACTCQQCRESCKNIWTLPTQKQVRKIQECKENKQEIARAFAGPLQNAIKARKYLLVSVDHILGYPGAKFLRNLTTATEKVIDILNNYISQLGIQQVKKMDPATLFRSKLFNEFCKTGWLSMSSVQSVIIDVM